MYYVVFDTETTGLEKLQGSLAQPHSVTKNGSEVIEIGGLFLDENMNPIKGFCHYCDCLASHSDAQAFATHQIQLEDIRAHISGVFLEEVMVNFLPEFYDEDILFIGYNANFDMRMTAQSLRDFPVPFKLGRRVTARMPTSGRNVLDVMDFLGPHRVKLSSFESWLQPYREEFMSLYRRVLPVETNITSMYLESWEKAHNALYDAVSTYLLFKHKIWGIKLVGGGRSRGY